uniref:Uncharacterized protein n=1 Tax=Physcomitrium patens TaxID=3218 RepID=A0A2K1L1P4_PHYPA|nr:hypothetical protein PHYPA_002735 [Physcomitrium patens]
MVYDIPSAADANLPEPTLENPNPSWSNPPLNVSPPPPTAPPPLCRPPPLQNPPESAMPLHGSPLTSEFTDTKPPPLSYHPRHHSNSTTSPNPHTLHLHHNSIVSAAPTKEKNEGGGETRNEGKLELRLYPKLQLLPSQGILENKHDPAASTTLTITRKNFCSLARALLVRRLCTVLRPLTNCLSSDPCL